MGLTAGSGHWDKAGEGLVPIVWAFVRDWGGAHRDEYLFSTDPTMSAGAMVEAHAGRRNLETTSQEVRCHLGLESTRGWCRRTALRAAPCPFGLDAAVAPLYQGLPEPKRSGRVEWPGKEGVTFSDALTSARRWLWRGWGFPRAGGGAAIDQLPEPLREALFYARAPAA